MSKVDVDVPRCVGPIAERFDVASDVAESGDEAGVEIDELCSEKPGERRGALRRTMRGIGQLSFAMRTASVTTRRLVSNVSSTD